MGESRSGTARLSSASSSSNAIPNNPTHHPKKSSTSLWSAVFFRKESGSWKMNQGGSMDSMFPMIFIFWNQNSISVDFVEPSIGWFWFWFSMIFLGKKLKKKRWFTEHSNPKRCNMFYLQIHPHETFNSKATEMISNRVDSDKQWSKPLVGWKSNRGLLLYTVI